MKTRKILGCLAVVAVAQFLAGAGQSVQSFKWTGVKMTDTEYLIYRSVPKDSTVHDVYMTCKRGSEDISVSMVTSQDVKYADEELVNGGKRLPQEAKFLIDGKPAGEMEVIAGQAEAFESGDKRAVSIDFEMTKDDALFKAMQKGKTLRFVLPKASSHAIPLARFAAMSKAMVAHCKL
jgi:hypothetical protein